MPDHTSEENDVPGSCNSIGQPLRHTLQLKELFWASCFIVSRFVCANTTTLFATRVYQCKSVFAIETEDDQ